MSDSPQSSATFHPTKQQLDELDALMRQMLALPGAEPPEFDVADASPGPTATSTAWVAAADSAPVLVDEPGPRRPLNPSPLLLRPDADPGAQSASRFGSDRLVADEIEAATAPVSDELAWWQLPLAGINLVFDGLLLPLGPIGRWLRQPAGRAFLGVLGWLMLMGAVVWGLLDWLGWTS